MRKIVGRRPLLGLLTTGRLEAQAAAAAELDGRLAPAISAFGVHGITFQDVHPPLAVVDAYRDVSRAESDRQRRINEGATVRAEKLAEAEGKAKAIVNAATAQGDRQLARASSEADSFGYQLAARATEPSLTDFRLYWKAVARRLPASPSSSLTPGPTSPSG